MNAKELPQYKEVITALTPLLYDLPGRLIAIDGKSGVGKTTLGRYLAWQFNISLVETDLFLIPNQGKLVYLNDALKHVITHRLDKPRPVIVDAVAVRRLLRDLSLKPDYVIYVSNSDAPEGRSLKDEVASYEVEFKPATSADLVIDVAHSWTVMSDDNRRFVEDFANPHSWLLTADDLHEQAVSLNNGRSQSSIMTKLDKDMRPELWDGYMTVMAAYGKKLTTLLIKGWRGPYGVGGKWKFEGEFLGHKRQLSARYRRAYSGLSERHCT